MKHSSALLRWTLTVCGIGLCAASAVTARRWFPQLAAFASENSNAIQGLTGMVQFALWATALVLLFVRLHRRDGQPDAGAKKRHDLLPPLPPMVVGRQDVLRDVRARLLDVAKSGNPPIVITGWPGIGKSTVVAALAHDAGLRRRFDGPLLWTALGREPDIRGALRGWARALELPLTTDDINATSALLRSHLEPLAPLLIVDDVWDAAHLEPFRVCGGRGAVLTTTRAPAVANGITTPEGIVRMPRLDEEDALEILRRIVPDVVRNHAGASRELIDAVERLPLAIHVAGRLLRNESEAGFGVEQLLATLREGKVLLEAAAPPDRADVTLETTPTVAVLLSRSTEHLPEGLLEKFAILGVTPSKPATFDLDYLRRMWQTDAPEPYVRQLVDRGLLEYDAKSKRYQMHALLTMHARSLLESR